MNIKDRHAAVQAGLVYRKKTKATILTNYWAADKEIK